MNKKKFISKANSWAWTKRNSFQIHLQSKSVPKTVHIRIIITNVIICAIDVTITEAVFCEKIFSVQQIYLSTF